MKLRVPEPAPAPARAAGPARDGETIIPLEMVCPPPPPGQNWYDSATPVGRIRVGRAQLGASIGAPPNAQYRVNIPITIELDVETDTLAPDIWVRSGNEVGTPRTYSLMSKVPNTVEFTVTSDTFYPPGTSIEMIIHGRLGAELIFNPRIGQVTSRNVIATTADGGRIVLPQVTVSVNQTVPRP